MSEKEIRAILQAVCTDLDRRVRKVVGQSVRKVVLPAALGAGVALSAGCDNGRTVNTGDADVGVAETGASNDMTPDVSTNNSLPPYMAPDPDFRRPRRDGGLDAPVYPPYMAPEPDAFNADGFEPPPEPDYMAPNPEPEPVPLYDAPPP